MTATTVYNGLRKDILDISLKPGEMIGEVEIAERFGVSRTPTRDAIKALVSEGLLEVRPHIGTFVSLINIRKVADFVFIRNALETAVQKELCATFNPVYAMSLEKILKRQAAIIDSEQTEETQWEFIQSDNQFHERIFEIAGRSGIWDVICSNGQHYSRFRTLLVKCQSDPLDTLYEQHRQIMDALVAHDWPTLEAVINTHVTQGFKRSIEIMDNYSSFFTS